MITLYKKKCVKNEHMRHETLVLNCGRLIVAVLLLPHEQSLERSRDRGRRGGWGWGRDGERRGRWVRDGGRSGRRASLTITAATVIVRFFRYIFDPHLSLTLSAVGLMMILVMDVWGVSWRGGGQDVGRRDRDGRSGGRWGGRRVRFTSGFVADVSETGQRWTQTDSGAGRALDGLLELQGRAEGQGQGQDRKWKRNRSDKRKQFGKADRRVEETHKSTKRRRTTSSSLNLLLKWGSKVFLTSLSATTPTSFPMLVT